MGSPFDSGKALVFKSMSTTGSKHYLKSDPSQPHVTSVFLADSLEFDSWYYWESNKQTDGAYHLSILSTADKCFYLNSSSANPLNASVFLSSANTSGDGSFWTPTQVADGAYIMKSHTSSGPKCFMNADPSAALANSVYLVDESGSVETQWLVGVDSFTGKEVESIICKVYPDIFIKFYQANPTYTSLLDYNLLLAIWKDSGLGAYHWSKEKFDCDDFAICLKGEVAKYS